MHGILAALDEYRCREAGADIAYEMSRKAKNGGTHRLPQCRREHRQTEDQHRPRRYRACAAREARLLQATGEPRRHVPDVPDEFTDRGLEPGPRSGVRPCQSWTRRSTTESPQAAPSQEPRTLAQLTVEEDNLLDLAADSSPPQERIRERLRVIARDRQYVTSHLRHVHGDLFSGRAFLNAHLELFENPYELYSPRQ